MVAVMPLVGSHLSSSEFFNLIMVGRHFELEYSLSGGEAVLCVAGYLASAWACTHEMTVEILPQL